MNNSALWSIPALALLAACGGGGGVATVNPPSYAADGLKTFDNGDGIARLEMTQNGDSYVANILVTDVQDVVKDFRNNGNSEYAKELDELAAALVSNTLAKTDDDYGTYYAGYIRIPVTSTAPGASQYTTGRVVAETFADETNSAAVTYPLNREALTLLAGGVSVSDLPSGKFAYTGRNFLKTKSGTSVEKGTFKMSVDFDDKTASILGNTRIFVPANRDDDDTTNDKDMVKYLSTLAGNMSIQIDEGTFTGNALSLTVFKDGGVDEDSVDNLSPEELEGITTQFSAVIYGNFHGEGAVAVSGLYADDKFIPEYRGAIVGSRPTDE